MPSQKSSKKRPQTESSSGMSRGRRGMFLRLPPDVYEKLQRMTAVRFAGGQRDGIQGTVIKLIQDAKETSL